MPEYDQETGAVEMSTKVRVIVRRVRVDSFTEGFELSFPELGYKHFVSLADFANRTCGAKPGEIIMRFGIEENEYIEEAFGINTVLGE